MIIVAKFTEDVKEPDKIYTLIHYVNDTMKSNKNEHIFKHLDNCLESNTKNDNCFLAKHEGTYINDYRLPNDFSIVIEIFTPWKNKASSGKRLKAFRWDQTAERFQFLVDHKMVGRNVVRRYESPEFFVNIEEESDNKIEYKYHTIKISPRSYYSEMVDQEIEMPVDYGKKMIPETEKDELVAYFFDHVSGFLFRRGKLSLTLYYFIPPRLIIQRNPDSKTDPVYDPPSAHLCKKPKVVKLFTENQKTARITTKEQ